MKKSALFFSICFILISSVSFSQYPNLTKTIEIYNSDSASISHFYKINLPQAGYKNFYIQLFGYWQGDLYDPRYGDVYRLNYNSNQFSDSYHNGILKNVIGWGTYGIEIAYVKDLRISTIDTNLILYGYYPPGWEPYQAAFYTDNNGISTHNIFGSIYMANCYGVAIDPVNDSIMYSGFLSGSNMANFYKTTNRGVNWIGIDTLSDNYSGSYYGGIWINPTNHNTVFVILGNSLFKSTTGGNTFQLISSDTLHSGKIFFTPSDNSIYIVCPSNRGIMKSTNSGDNWVQIFNKPCNDLEFDPLDGNIFYAATGNGYYGTGEGIFKSTNKGLNWFLYNNTFAPSKNIMGIVKNPNSGDTIYAATTKAVYKVFGQAILDTITPKYFPLAVGNVYKYHFASSAFVSYDHKLRIYKDTIIDSKKYFVTDNGFPGIPGTMFRFDSLTGNLYCRSNTYCSYHPFEELVDSLTSRKGDSIIRCNTTPDKHYCLDTGSTTLLGTSVKTKSFIAYNIEGNESVTYSTGFGLSTYEAQDFGGIGIDQLIGCYIGGVLYGDTSDIVTTYAVSGTVRYSDNNQLVTSGIVRAFKLDKSDAKIVILDSANIQSNGTYALPNVPHDSLYIGVFPNSTPPNDYVITYYPSTTYWENAITLYPSGNMTNVDISAIRMFSGDADNSVSGKVMRLTDAVIGNLKDAFVYAKRSNTYVGCTITDDNGVYHIKYLPTGYLKIIVNRPGFMSDSTSVFVTSTSKIDSVNFGLKLITTLKQTSESVPTEYKLFQNYPNPFNPSTIIRFQIPKSKNGPVVLKVYDILGREVATLVNENLKPGTYEVPFSINQFSGNQQASGVYFYRLTTQNFSDVKRMILIK